MSQDYVTLLQARAD